MRAAIFPTNIDRSLNRMLEVDSDKSRYFWRETANDGDEPGAWEPFDACRGTGTGRRVRVVPLSRTLAQLRTATGSVDHFECEIVRAFVGRNGPYQELRQARGDGTAMYRSYGRFAQASHDDALQKFGYHSCKIPSLQASAL